MDSVLKDMTYRFERKPNENTFLKYLKIEKVVFKTRDDEYDYREVVVEKNEFYGNWERTEYAKTWLRVVEEIHKTWKPQTVDTLNRYFVKNRYCRFELDYDFSLGSQSFISVLQKKFMHRIDFDEDNEARFYIDVEEVKEYSHERFLNSMEYFDYGTRQLILRGLRDKEDQVNEMINFEES